MDTDTDTDARSDSHPTPEPDPAVRELAKEMGGRALSRALFFQDYLRDLPRHIREMYELNPD